MSDHLIRLVPILTWARDYDRAIFGDDLIAALIVMIMLIPQSLAYAILAGLPPEAGLYASIVPILAVYCIWHQPQSGGWPRRGGVADDRRCFKQYRRARHCGLCFAALSLAGLSGMMLLLLGLFRLGFLANFLSHPVISGFITASGLIIAASQLRHIFGIDAAGHNLLDLIVSVVMHLPQINLPTAVIGVGATVFLFWVRKGLKPALRGFGLGETAADVATKAGPVVAVVATTVAVWTFDLAQAGVQIVGTVPQSLPPFTLPSFSPALLQQLVLPAFMISVIGFVESISVAQTLAAKNGSGLIPTKSLLVLARLIWALHLRAVFLLRAGFRGPL